MLFNLTPFSCEISSLLINHTEVSLLSDYCLNHINTQLTLLRSFQINTHSYSFLKHDIYMHICGLSHHMFYRSLQLCSSTHTCVPPCVLGEILCVQFCVCVYGIWGSSLLQLTAELNWSESMRPCHDENREIKHYHQKRLWCSLLQTHSFLQSSCFFFICLLCQWSFFFCCLNQCTFQLQLFDGEGDEQLRHTVQKRTTERWSAHLLSFLF